MEEMKIMFKNGEYGYYEPISLSAKEIFKTIIDVKSSLYYKTIVLKEIANGKCTVIDIQEIVTFGYSTVD